MSTHPSKLPARDLEAAGLVGAECAYDPDLHTGPHDAIEPADQAAAREDVAREICRTCPVLAQCLTRAIRLRPQRGVWGAIPATMLAGHFTGRTVPTAADVA